MANTTDLIITCVDNDEAIEFLSQKTGVNFNKVTDSEKCGGSKIVYFESYAACYRSLGKEKIEEIINEFKVMNMYLPELAVLMVHDDDGAYEGVVLRH